MNFINLKFYPFYVLFCLAIGLFCFLAGCERKNDNLDKGGYITVYINEKGDTTNSIQHHYYIVYSADGHLIKINDSTYIPTYRVLTIKEIR